MKNNNKKKRINKLFKLKGEPRVIAKSFALGSFVGMLPFPGFQMIISGTLAAILKYNRTAAIVGVFNTNLATGGFVFAFNYWLGKKILGIETPFQIPDHINLGLTKTIIESGSGVFFSLLLGGFITGIISMILSYYISLFILSKNAKSETY